ncbi:MAG: cryptochrome/photolyase family protein [Phycisphaeraceae bacterium]|nr:MAG: cryptochrome/photolyase family protein [Phycisphaeraceae bacterium]
MSSARSKKLDGGADSVRTLAIVLGDQLTHTSPIFDDFDNSRDAVLMMEVSAESTHVPSHRQRTALFLSAMRHFAVELMERGRRVRYTRLDDEDNTHTFTGEVRRAAAALKPQRLAIVHPGEWRVLEMARSWEDALDVPVDILPDTHFLCPLEEFDDWAADRRTMVMEHFYRRIRRGMNVLLTKDGKPVGGEWNYDKLNRKAFRSAPATPPPYTPRPDDITKRVMQMVESHLPDLPGRLDDFRWPVTRAEALRALDDFIERRLPDFGDHQDAMWTGAPWLNHSLLSTSLNLKLLDPRECVEKAIAAHEAGRAPLNSVEGFVRQIIGWREFIRGVYWREGPEYARRNALDQHGALPKMYWTGDTPMNCMRDCIGSVLQHGYGHHIQRLMVTGNFALIAGVHPRAVSDWYLGMYVDAVDWVTLPNTLGMAMHADGAVVGTKPYASGGRYIDRMSNYCAGCRYDPTRRDGDAACPFTVFYWDFLIRNRTRFAKNTRMSMILKNVDRMSETEQRALRDKARSLRIEFGVEQS